MNISRRHALSLLAAAPAFSQTSPAAGNVILKAMADEIARSKQLRVLNAKDPVYFTEFALDDAQTYSVNATLGALVNERRNHFRVPRVSVRIGSTDFDNTNYLFSDFYIGSRFDSDQFSLDDDYDVLRQSFWLATDRAFKAALESIGRKRAALRNITQPDKLPDFSNAPVVQKIIAVPKSKLDEAKWRSLTVALSAVFSPYPEIFDSTAEFDSTQSGAYLANSDGTLCLSPDVLFSMKFRASAQASDGMRVRSHAAVHALNAGKMPGEAELRRAATAVADEVKALAAAPRGESYSGPVLFEGQAAAQMFADVLGGALVSSRKPVNEPSRPANFPPNPFEGRVGSRVLPESFTVVDDPLQSEWKSRALLGGYAVDIEGTVPEKLTVIEKGILKTLLSTRTPTKDASSSNGRARLPGPFGTKAAAITNLFVSPAEGVPAAELKSKFLKLVADRGKPYGILVRKMDFPSTLPVSEARRYMNPQEKPAAPPLLVYRIFPDGREELVRGLRFRGFTARSLRDIVAASSDLFAFDFLGNLAPFSLTGAGGYVYTSTVIAPPVLFEDVELETLDQDLPRLPIVPIPPSGGE